MDENGKPAESPAELKNHGSPTTLKKRFTGFVLYHASYSLVFSLSFLQVFMLIVNLTHASMAPSLDGSSGIPLLPVALFAALGMALYFPLGMLAARWGRWTAPTPQEKLQSIAQSFGALAAWVLLLFCLFAISHFGGQLGYSIINLAILGLMVVGPSVLSALCLMPIMGGMGMFIFSLVCLLCAALPPLLFGLGSFWQSRRQSPLPGNSPTP